MKNIFISSVINGFEDYRLAAKKAIELMDCKSIMSEEFGARSYSSEVACIHEVEQSDIYILIMGEKYGYEIEGGLSVTQSEFRAAQAANRPILVFIENCEMEPKQEKFNNEVEDFQGGLFREVFQSAEELKDSVVKSLRQLETMNQAISEDELNRRIKNALEEAKESHFLIETEPEMVMVFLPQPERLVDIVGLEDKLDNIFLTMSKMGLVKMMDGYKAIQESHWTGIEANGLQVSYFADGLVMLRVNPTIKNGLLMSGSFAPPEELIRYATGFKTLITENAGYVHCGVYNMGNTYVAPMPEGSSFSMKMFGDDDVSFNRLFTPITDGAYHDWIELCVKRFSRIFKYE